jgi:Raf kinase inhibitor-like YbhB/YbcL family protein
MPGDSQRRPRSDALRRTGGEARAAAPAVALAVAALVAVVVVAGLLLAACGDSKEGRVLRPPSPDQTTTSSTTAPAEEAGGADAGSASGDAGGSSTTRGPLQLSSSAIPAGGEIPLDHTCRGADVSPPLLWTGVPAGTAELAVVVRDMSAEGFVHWVIAGIPATTGGIAAGTPPDGAVEAANDFGRSGWAGPCPPSGSHDYEFVVYALAQPSGLTAAEAAPDAAARIEQTPALSSAALSATASAG